MKTCKVCGCGLSTGNTYKSDPNRCKDCIKARVRKNRAEKVDYYRAFDRKRYADSEERRDHAKSCVLKARAEGKYPEYQKRHRQKHPDRYKARTAVGNAIRGGKLAKGPCEECGATEGVEAHHDDYSQPLVVRWFCPAHHGTLHRDLGDMQVHDG